MTVVSFSMAYRSFRGGSGRLDTRLDTPPSINRRHPDSCLAPAADRMGREGGAQGGPCRAVATAHGTQTRLRRLLYLQEHGAGADLPGQRTEISHQGPASP